jgi:hypothetical protein
LTPLKSPQIPSSARARDPAALTVRAVFPDATDDEIETLVEERKARGARNPAAVLAYEIREGELRLPCDRGGPGRSNACQDGDGGGCAYDWCACRCHTGPASPENGRAPLGPEQVAAFIAAPEEEQPMTTVQDQDLSGGGYPGWGLCPVCEGWFCTSGYGGTLARHGGRKHPCRGSGKAPARRAARPPGEETWHPDAGADNADLGVGVCAVCRRRISVQRGGGLREHKGGDGYRCGGSQRPPAGAVTPP